MITLVADENIPFLRGILEPFARVVYLPGTDITPEIVKNADGLLIRTRTRCSRELLEGSAVRFIATATIGYDHIDTPYCEQNGIIWRHAAGCNASGVEQYMTAALLHLAFAHNFRLSGKIIAVIGVGNVGKRVARAALGLGMEVLLSDPPRERIEGPAQYTGIPEILREADIITFHVPLTMTGPDKTYLLADDVFLSSLAKKPFIINTSRGDVVDEQALKKHLVKGTTAGAVADVWKNEPALDRELLSLTGIGTPHIAGYSTEGKSNGTAFCVRQASKFFGFGIDDWYPHPLPEPQKSEIIVSCQGGHAEETLCKVVRQAYDIIADDCALRNNPAHFEKIRNDYPVRREFPAFTVRLGGNDPGSARLLSQVGFRVEVSGRTGF